MKVEQVAIRTSYFSIAGNALLALAKALAGFFGNSFALIADAIESLTDVFLQPWYSWDSGMPASRQTTTIHTGTEG